MVDRKGKRVLLISVTLLICGIYIFISDIIAKSSPQEETESGENLYCYVDGREGISGTRIINQEVDEKNYLFLPSGMDLSALVLNFSCPLGEWVTFNDSIIKDKIVIDVFNQGTYNKEEKTYKLLFQVCDAGGLAEDYELWIMESSNIPSVFLVSDDEAEGRSWVEATKDHSNVAEASVYELDKNGYLICKQRAEKLRIRGNFTASAKKKAYQIKLSSKEDMLEIGEPRKSFALLANSYDTSLQHNTISYQLGKELGLSDSPDCQPVDVYYDGEYVGNYLLTELPGISNTNVAIEENGSYLMQIDYSHYMEREHYLELSNGMFVTIEEPEHISADQIEYVRQIWEELVETMEHGGTHPTNGKTIEDYVDLESYARYYLVQQFSKNPDGFSSSTYCYIPSDEDKIYFCSLWDFDLCYGIDHQLSELTDPEGFYPDNVGSDISVIPAVFQKIKDVYENEMSPMVQNILLGDAGQQGEYIKSLAGYNEEIYASQRMNYMLWDFNQTGITIHFKSYEESVEYLREFVVNRHDWLSETLEGWTGCRETEEICLFAEKPLAGMPVETDIELLDKWCGGKIASANFLEQGSLFDSKEEYHYRVTLMSQLGSSFTENTIVVSNLGKIESQTMLENGMIEVVLNVGLPEITNTVYEGVNYAPVYDKEYYLSHYPQVEEQVGTSDEAVLKYFVTEGMKEAHQGCEDFDVNVYIARYPIFDGLDYPDVYMHYLTEGIFQEWSGKR
ncbi:MAG: CotH kinase family protein [Roseburia sp.]|nr:CotH kinase family protein [Roseburia sp.]